MVQLVRIPNGAHEIIRVFLDSTVIEFRSYELVDLNWVRTCATHRLYAAGFCGNISEMADEVTSMVMHLDGLGLAI